MKKNRVIQLFLIIGAVGLFFSTYYFGQKNINENNLTKNINENMEKISDVPEGISNIIEEVNYSSTDNRGTFFELNANIAEIFHDKPNISNMKVVDAFISLKDGRRIYIKSDYAIYDQITNNTNFWGNVSIVESANKITSKNLDLLMTENLISIYNQVKYNGIQARLVADKVDINILNKETSIFMFDEQNKVQVKYKN